MGKLSYSTAEIDAGLRKVIYPYRAFLSRDTDVADTVIFAAGEINTFKTLNLAVTMTHANGFTLVGDVFTFTEEETEFEFNGQITLSTSVVNTTIHLRMAVNGVSDPRSESGNKIETTTDLDVFGGVAATTLYPGDIVTIQIKADKACTISAYHPQLLFREI